MNYNVPNSELEGHMDNRIRTNLLRGGKLLVVAAIVFTLLKLPTPVSADSSIPQTDQTPIAPLSKPGSTAQPRYISGFGIDNVYTIFYEDRLDTVGCTNPETFRIYYNQTTTGPFGFAVTGTATNICDTHFIVKNWPITIGSTTYSYRGWGAQGNNPSHAFYVSNDLVHWMEIYNGVSMFSDTSNVLAGDTILYGFHDIVQLNSNYMGWVETAGGRTFIVWSDQGDEHWKVIGEVGGAVAGAGPLNMYFFPGISGPKPSGNFVLMELDGQLAYTKLYLAGDYRGAYMAINRAAAQAATPSQAEAAFINPANWTWRNGTTGLPTLADTVIASTYGTGGHDIREAWTVPMSNYRSDHVVLYTASYAVGSAKGLGCASASAQCLVVSGSPSAEILPATLSSVSSLPKLIIPATGFAQDKVNILPKQTVDYSIEKDLWLEIPKIGVAMDVVGVPLQDNTWDVTWLGEDAGWLEGTAYPTTAGNTTLTGHVWDALNHPGPFIGLNQLGWGDEVIVHAGGADFVYEVRSVKTVNPENTSFITKHEEYSWLTLITCKNYNSATSEYDDRLVVRAVLVEVR
jgi:LPXTG-site transpeptidase (sortase) family protein